MKTMLRRRPIGALGLLLTIAGVGLWIAGLGMGRTVAVVGAFVAVLGGNTDNVRAWYLSLAIVHGRRALKLSAAGRYEEAEEDAAGWVRNARKLVFARPADVKQLSQALTSLWSVLTKLDRHADALVIAEEAVAVGRIAAARSHWERIYLADALELLECSVSALPGERVGPAADELIMVRADIANDAGNRHARALALVAEQHTDLQEHDAALPLFEELVRIRRNLPNARAKLESALTDLGHCLTELREYDRARAAYAEAVEIRRTLDDLDPNRLAGLLFNLAGSLRELQRYDDAAIAGAEAVEIFRADLHSDEPHPKAVERVTWALGLLADDLRDLHRHEEALAAYSEVLDVYRSAEEPDAQSISDALQPVIRTLRTLGRHAEARPLEDELAALQKQRPTAGTYVLRIPAQDQAS